MPGCDTAYAFLCKERSGMEMNMDKKLFSRDFTRVVIGQIISLFGNAALRFALPLYLLNQTGSSGIYGAVTACAFLPMILLSPIGGIIADRVNKRNIMVVLDFFTAAVIVVFLLMMGKMNLIVLLVITLMLLYGIAGAYQPSVQASVPVLVHPENIVSANSVINTISSFSSLLGPVLGGLLYSIYGLVPVLLMCTACFVCSAVMEIFIKIPFTRQENRNGMLGTVKNDFLESVRFIRLERPVIFKGILVVCAINLFLSAMLVVGLPYLITEVLQFSKVQANQYCGYAQGALAAGGLAGGICSGLFAKKITIQKMGTLLAGCAICIFPMGLSLLLSPSDFISYLMITVCCFVIMLLSTIFTVQMLSFVQAETPPHLIGKVISVTLTGSMCAQPLGNILYGMLFEVCKGSEFIVLLFAGVVSLAVAVLTKNIFEKIPYTAAEISE